jgi:hypothetical protein
MLRVHADGAVVYDSRLEEYALLGLKTTTGVNKGGTAEIVMPPGHPAYNAFTSYKTLVTLRENDVLRFRGRALYPSDDFYNIRTIVCEGERCFLRDGIIRPYLFQDTPAAIFATALELYNAQVDDFKRFTLGQVTVTDPNDYVRLESDSAEHFDVFYDKLLERCGGYITFSDAEDGSRAINWLASLDTYSAQPIELGENLLEFARSGESAELATAILPYGAMLDDGTRVTIESVTADGSDWIQDDEAVALRGFIMATVTWDDVTDPANLLTKAQQWLAEHKLAVVSLQLTAADLSRIDRSIDSYEDGDLVQVLSKPHSMDGWLQLTERVTDWLNPTENKITLGQTLATLTGADVIAAQAAGKAVSAAKVAAVQASRAETATAVKTLETSLTAKIEQLAGSISLEVSGGLGNTAAIRLTVDGNAYTESLQLDNVRQAFADDPSAVTISGGTVTFNAGTFVVNSSKFTVDKQGKITATDAVIYGDIITIDGSYKTELDRGSLRLYYGDVLCGTINTKYWSGAATEGVSLRVEEGGHYIMFSHADDSQGSGYVVDYYLNAGWSSNYEEMHIFQTSARFLDGLYVSGPARIRSLRLFGADGEYLVGINSSGGLSVSKI